MRVGIAALILAYVLSQFYRAFLAVLTPALQADLGAGADDLAAASGYWFLAFALMQPPVGWALDKIGPRLTTAVLLAVGAAGVALFAMAQSVAAVHVAMALIGAGCAPVLMAAYYIFARIYAPQVFGTLAGVTIGIGSLGNIGASLPLTLATEAFGWRPTLLALAGLTLVVAGLILLLVRDPAKVEGGPQGSLLDLLKMRALWPILVMMAVCYAPAAGLRGLWIGPYLRDVFGADAAGIGQASLIMGLAMVAGNFAYGPMDRVLGTRKGLILGGNIIVLGLLSALWLQPGSAVVAVVLMAGIGFFGASFPMVVAHGRAFCPPHLMGRGVTLLNLAGIGATGLLQLMTARLHAGAPTDPAAAPYTAVFGLLALVLAAGLVVYAMSRDRTD